MALTLFFFVLLRLAGGESWRGPTGGPRCVALWGALGWDRGGPIGGARGVMGAVEGAAAHRRGAHSWRQVCLCTSEVVKHLHENRRLRRAYYWNFVLELLRAGAWARDARGGLWAHRRGAHWRLGCARKER